MANLVQKCQAVHCRVVGHEHNNINRICIEINCKMTRLVCDRCGNLHRSHRGSLLTIAEVQDALERFESSSESLANQGRFEQIAEDFSELVQTLFKALLEEVKQLLNFSNSLKIRFLKHDQNSYEELDLQMDQLSKFVNLKDGEIQFKIQKPSDLYPSISHRLRQHFQEINDFLEKKLGYENKMINIVQIEMPQQQYYQQFNTQTQLLQNETNTKQLQQKLEEVKSKSIPLQEQLDLFTQESCSEQIKCITPKCVRKIGVNNTNDIACLNKSLSFQEKQSFVFRINRLAEYIGIGISIFQQVQANNFTFGDLNKLGHGVFMVLNNGLVYNNTDNKFNKFDGSFQLIEGQKYKLTFDPWNAQGTQLSIQSLSQKPTTFSMPMQIVEGYDYHVFVYMGQQDGEVEILDEI